MALEIIRHLSEDEQDEALTHVRLLNALTPATRQKVAWTLVPSAR